MRVVYPFHQFVMELAPGAEIFSISRTLLMAEPPPELVRIAHKPIQDVAPQAIDLLHITPLLRAEAHNLPGLEPTVVEQVGQPQLALVGQHRLQDLPDLASVSLFFCERFK